MKNDDSGELIQPHEIPLGVTDTRRGRCWRIGMAGKNKEKQEMLVDEITLAPVLLFTYKRLQHTKKTVEALKANDWAGQSELIIFSDGAKYESDASAVNDVREYLRSIDGFRKISIRESKSNQGLAQSVIAGVTSVVNEFGSVIVLEDDMVTSRYFLRFMNEALVRFAADDRICQIHGFSYPTKISECAYFLRRGASCWGWATWQESWRLFRPDAAELLAELKQKKCCREFDIEGAFPFSKMLHDQALGKIDSWAIRWYASSFLANRYTLQSNVSLVDNIGCDGEGTHCIAQKQYEIVLADAPVVWEGTPEKETPALRAEYRFYLSLKRCLC